MMCSRGRALPAAAALAGLLFSAYHSANAGVWQRLEASPSFIAASSVVDPVRHRLIVYGIRHPAAAASEAWSLSLDSLADWQAVSTLGVAPDRRGHAIVIADPISDRILVAGNADPSGLGPGYQDLWELRFPPPGSPSAAAPAQWSRLQFTEAGFGTPAAGLDSRRNRFLQYGGGADLRDLHFPWFFDNRSVAVELGGVATKTVLSTNVPPIGRILAAAAYDSTHDRFVIFGGARPTSGGDLNDTWSLLFAGDPQGDSGTWVPVPNVGAVPARGMQADSWVDAERRELCILESDSTFVSMDLARADTAVWTRTTILGPRPPAPRTLAWDVRSRKLWSYGFLHGELWSLTREPVAHWERVLAPPPPAPARDGGVRIVHDTSRDRSYLLFGSDPLAGGLATSGAVGEAHALRRMGRRATAHVGLRRTNRQCRDHA